MQLEKRATLSIVSHGHGRLVSLLLDDISRQHQAEAFDVVVTLNIPETPPDPAKHPTLSLRIRHNAEPLGFGANHNAALKTAQTPWVIILNPDIRLPEPLTLTNLLERDADSRTGMRAPIIVSPTGEREDSIRGNLDPFSVLRRVARSRLGLPKEAAAAHGTGRFFWLAGMFLCVPADVFRRVGGFDERFFLYCEDYDLSARIVRSGRVLEICHDVTAVHDARRSSHASMRYLRLHLHSLVKVWLSPTFWVIWARDLRVAVGRLLKA